MDIKVSVRQRYTWERICKMLSKQTRPHVVWDALPAGDYYITCTSNGVHELVKYFDESGDFVKVNFDDLSYEDKRRIHVIVSCLSGSVKINNTEINPAFVLQGN